MNGAEPSNSTLAEVAIQTGARLHCGLFSDERPGGRRFQGFGLMIDRPGFRILASRNEESHHRVKLTAKTDEVSETAQELIDKAETCLRNLDATTDNPVYLDLEITRILTPHTGLGSGTQLAYAVATVWNELNGGLYSVGDFRELLQRGKRSCIGSFGFYRGGLLIDAGMTREESRGSCRFAALLPAEWRVLLASPKGAHGIAGTAELEAFRKLPPLAERDVDRLEAMLEQLETAVNDFDLFSSILREFGLVVGESFAEVQGGRFSHPGCEQIFEAFTQCGISGVAQSSWGPTMFGLCRDSAQAGEVAERLENLLPAADFSLEIAAPMNRGAALTLAPEETAESG